MLSVAEYLDHHADVNPHIACDTFLKAIQPASIEEDDIAYHASEHKSTTGSAHHISLADRHDRR